MADYHMLGYGSAEQPGEKRINCFHTIKEEVLDQLFVMCVCFPNKRKDPGLSAPSFATALASGLAALLFHSSALAPSKVYPLRPQTVKPLP